MKQKINESVIDNDTHYAIHKETGLCVFSWDYHDEDPEDLRLFKNDYFWVDLRDNGFNPKMFKIVTMKRLKRKPPLSNTGIFPLKQEYEISENGEDFWKLAHEESPETFINESIYKNKMKQKIRLSESTLHRIIKESVKRILKEAKNDFEPSKYQGKWSVYDKGSRTFSHIGVGKKKAFDKARELNDYCGEKDKEEKNEGRILRHIIKESVRRILMEQYEFDNVDDTDIERFIDNYTEVTVPDFCLPYLVNGDTEGYDDEELEAMQNFEKEWQGKLANGLNIGDICIPQDGKSPSYRSYNDVFGNIGCDCYRFLVPLDYKIEKQ